MRTTERRYRVRQFSSVLGYFASKDQARRYLEICTIDDRPARKMGAVLEFDRFGEWEWEVLSA